MSGDPLFFLAVGTLLASCFVAVGAKSLRQFSRHELEEVCRRRSNPDRFGEILKHHQHVSLGLDHLLILLMALIVASAASWGWTQWDAIPDGSRGTLATIATALLLGTILSLTIIWIPWSVARLWAEPFLFHTWRIWQLTSSAATPLVWGAQATDGLLHRLAGRTPQEPSEDSFEEEIRTIVTEGHREGLLEEDAREMIEGVMELGDADVSEIMTPRTDIHMLNVRLSWDEMLDYVIQVGHTRIPVYDKNRDDIVGILHSKDLLPELAKRADQTRRPFPDLLRQPYFVPETKKVDALLEEFQQNRNHLAVVLDEYGGVSGLVTIEDVLEEIVGEIVDEYDEELVEEIKIIDDHTCEALGRAHVDEINETMGIHLPEDGDFDTIGGFVFSQLGHIPAPAESVVWDNSIQVTVLEASRRRIDRVRLELLDRPVREIA